MTELTIMIGTIVLLFFGTLIAIATRYKRCPPDRILVIYGKTGVGKNGRSGKCYHGGGAFVWPIIQSSQFLDLTPIPIDIRLEGALSQQNIRVNTPSTFTVGISTEPGVMENAAERLLGLTLPEVQDLAKDIIFGQMRVVIATMPIEEINADRDKLIDNISNGVEVELKKVGLRLINVNIQDITDESGYINALGQEAAARAINEAKVKVAEKERDGEIGKANAEQMQRIEVARAHSQAVEGENNAAVTIAKSNAIRREQEAEANRVGSAAERVKQADAEREAYAAEQEAEAARATREEATQYADIVVPAMVEKQRIETLAEAEAEQIRRMEKGKADGIRSVMEAEAEGVKAQLSAKAEGFKEVFEATKDNPDLSALMLMIEQLPDLVAEQVKAISNLKIDKVTVWDGGGNNGGNGSTADFVSNLVKSLPPLHELTGNVGIQLPEFLGRLDGDRPSSSKISYPTQREISPSTEEAAEPISDRVDSQT
ncbi:MAG: flotillin [Verrucomicrobiales bacterium]|nr:flotillin [Verrucomicrobiales bacterium]